MRNHLILLFGLIVFLFCVMESTAQTFNKVAVDPKIKQEVLIGLCDRAGLQLPVFDIYYEAEYKTYEPDIKIIDKLKQLPSDWHAVIVLGTWCSDSQREVPRFFRIIDEAGISDKMITMYGVGRDKSAGDVDISSLEITLVPTFVFYRKGKEIGRIVESPISSMEKDMLVLLALPHKPESIAE